MKKVLIVSGLALMTATGVYAKTERFYCPSLNISSSPTTNTGWVNSAPISNEPSYANDIFNFNGKTYLTCSIPQNWATIQNIGVTKMTVDGYSEGQCKISEDKKNFTCSDGVEPAPYVFIGTDERIVDGIMYEPFCSATLSQFQNTPQDIERASGGCQINGYNYGGTLENIKAVWGVNVCMKVSSIMCYTSPQANSGSEGMDSTGDNKEGKKGNYFFDSWGW